MTMLLGVEAEARSALVALRRAHGELAVLRQAELERAAAEERNRLSRELHDGLSQNLWFVKLKAGRLGELLTDAAERALVDEVSEGIDEALADARQAVMALRVGPGGDDSLGSLLRRYVEDFADRFAVRVRVAVDREIPRQSYRTEAELLHVAHEALMNTVRHADASLVQVRLEMSHAELSLSIVDNGRGFDSGVVHGGSFGLRGIRERAEILGGRCSIDSRLHDGTRLVVTVPLGGAAVDPRAGSGQAVPA
jgi:signal transduction histidine kinase